MSDADLEKEISIKLPVGHLLIVWDILSNKLPDLPIKDACTDEEIRAIWALEDLCERELINNGITGKPENEWDQLIEQATEFVKSMPVDFLD